METKICNTIRHWLPEFYDALEGTLESYNEFSDHKLLRNLAVTCIEKLNTGNQEDHEYVEEVFKIINILYESGDTYVKNVVEKEFLGILLADESPRSFKKHLDIFPSKLKEGYIKTILEN